MKHFRACCVSLFAAILGACAEDPAAPARSSIEGRIQYTDGQPAEGVVVIVGNKPPVNSDAAGMFRVDRVGPTYDITLLNGASALVYSGLTRRDPFFEFWGGGLGRGGFNPPFVSFSTATISGVVPPAADKTTKVYFAPNDMVSGAIASPSTGDFTLEVRWSGPTVEGTLYLLRWTAGADGLPAQYDAFASRPLVLTAGSSTTEGFTGADLSDPPEAQVSGSVGIPSGYELESITTMMSIGGASFLYHWQYRRPIPGATFDYTVPILPDAEFSVEAFASQGGQHTFRRRPHITPPESGIVLDLPLSPQIIAPANASVVGRWTEFRWMEGGGPGVYCVWITGPTNFVLFLNGTSTRIPDLREHGFGLRPGGYYTWAVYKYFQYANVDELASFEERHTTRPEIGFAYSSDRTFTTPP